MASLRVRCRAMFASPALTVFLALVLVQGFHELEHLAQVVQRFALGMPDANGIVGSLADVEPVHFVYNSVYLGLLVAVFVLLGLGRDGPTPHGRLVAALVTFAVAFQMWHELEHVFKLTQYVALGVNGTGGIFGEGPGAVAPRFPIPLLHLVYNSLAFAPALVAFVLMLRRLDVPDDGRTVNRRQLESRDDGAAAPSA